MLSNHDLVSLGQLTRFVGMDSLIYSCPLWSWPLRTLPRLTNAGHFPLADRDFRHRYWQETSIAIHLYDYHARFRLDGNDYALEPDTLSISPGGSETRYHLDVPGHHWCVHLQPSGDAGPCVSLPVVQHLGARAAYTRERFARLALLFDRALPDDHPRQVAAGAALQELLCWLASTQTDMQTPVVARSDHAVEHAAELLRGDFTHEWTVPSLAHAVGLSSNYLAARFRQRFAMTIARYRLVQRIHDARLLLAGSDVPVGEVARRVGIPDPHHFNKLFRRIAGVPPSAARKKADG